MIYEKSNADDPIRQGDIFEALPRLDVSLSELGIIDVEGNPAKSSWDAARPVGQTEPLTVVAVATPVRAIVISQDCDCLNKTYINLCEIARMTDPLPKSPLDRARKLMQWSLTSPRAFYLPADPEVAGLEERMVVDFGVTLRLKREDLQSLCSRRRCRLGSEAYQHFREALAQYLRRYPVDGWYVLDAVEFAAYRSKYPDVKPRAWQMHSPEEKESKDK